MFSISNRPSYPAVFCSYYFYMFYVVLHQFVHLNVTCVDLRKSIITTRDKIQNSQNSWKFQIQTRKILKRKTPKKQHRLEPDEKRRTSTKPNLIFIYLYETTRDHTFSLNVLIFILLYQFYKNDYYETRDQI